MKETLKRLRDRLEHEFGRRHIPTGCVFVALTALAMTLLIFGMQGIALLSPGIGAYYHRELLVQAQWITGGMLVFELGVAWYGWRHAQSTGDHAWLAALLSTVLLLSTTLTAILYGLKDMPMGLMFLSAVALLLSWFPARLVWPGTALSVIAILACEVLTRAGTLAYAPLLTEPVVTGRPMAPWWRNWAEVLYNLEALFFSGLMFFLFMMMNRRNQQLEEIARSDALTGLLNRGTFMHLLAEECARQRRTQRPACVMLCDIDHFRRVNDAWGMPAGDLVLRRLAHLLQELTRHPVDVAARYGGGDFALLMPETDLLAARAVAERIREFLRSQPFEVDGQRFHVTLSIGIAEARDGDEARTLKLADDNRYYAKASGRDRVVASVVNERR